MCFNPHASTLVKAVCATESPVAKMMPAIKPLQNGVLQQNYFANPPTNLETMKKGEL